MKKNIEVLKTINKPDEFLRVDSVHPLDLYIGKDEYLKPTLALVSPSKPTKISSSRYISISIYKRQDNQWSISFSLNNNDYLEIFTLFCEDMIESSRYIISKTAGTEFLCERYSKWQDMLSKKRDLLTPSEIKGLIGELYFLEHYMIPKYGPEQAINSWIGPEGAHQDFVISDTWYEVKSISLDATQVSISSIEQLDTENEGLLVTVVMDKTSSECTNCLSLNVLVDEIMTLIEPSGCRSLLYRILFNKGYYKREEYDEPIFSVIKMQKYIVNDKFPALRKKDVNQAIVRAEYSLALLSIQRFLAEDIQ